MVNKLIFASIITLMLICTGWTSEKIMTENIIPFMLVENEYIVIEVTVNDSITGNWLLDTGAGIHVLSNKLFRQLQTTPAGRLTAFRMGGERLDLDVSKISSISLGPFRQENPYICTMDKLDSLGIDGALSVKFFEHNPVTIDFKNNHLIFETKETLRDRTENGSVVNLETQRYRDKSLDIHVVFQANDSIELELELDTGSGKKIYFHSRFMELLGLDTESENVQAIPVNDDVIYKSPIQKLTLYNAPDIMLDSPEIYFQDNLIYDGVIGIEFWKDKLVTIDIQGKRIIVGY